MLGELLTLRVWLSREKMKIKAISKTSVIRQREFRGRLASVPSLCSASAAFRRPPCSLPRFRIIPSNPLLGCSNCCEFTHETAQFHARNTFQIIRIVQELTVPHAYTKWSTQISSRTERFSLAPFPNFLHVPVTVCSLTGAPNNCPVTAHRTSCRISNILIPINI